MPNFTYNKERWGSEPTRNMRGSVDRKLLREDIEGTKILAKLASYDF